MRDNKNTGEQAAKVSGNAAWAMDMNARALALDPRVATAYVNLAILYHNQGMRDETVAVLDKGLTVVPHDEILLMMRRDFETAEEARGSCDCKTSNV